MAPQTDLPTFTSGRISVALNIPQPTFQAWQKASVLKFLDSAPTNISGKARRYTVRDVCQLAIIRRLAEAILQPREAAVVARQAVDALDEYGDGQVQTLRIHFYDNGGRPKVQIFGPETSVPPPPDAIMVVTINLLVLFASAKKRLEALEAPQPEFRIADVVEILTEKADAPEPVSS